MALGIVRRWSWLPVVAGVCGVLQACSGSSGDDDSSDSRCTKDSDCRDGRSCESKKCIDDPNTGAVLGGSSGSGGAMNGSGGTSAPANGGTGFATDGSSAKGGSSGTSGSASGAANGGSSPGTGGTGGTSGTGGSAAGTGGSSGTAGAGTCSEDDPATCPTADSMTFCSGGALVTYDCSDYCDALGFPVGPCAAPDGCACDFENPTDETCVAATNGYCGCYDGTDTPCVDTLDPNDPDSIYHYYPFIYATCHGGSQENMDFFHCLADQTMLDPAPLCGDAFEACGADVGAAGAGG